MRRLLLFWLYQIFRQTSQMGKHRQPANTARTWITPFAFFLVDGSECYDVLLIMLDSVQLFATIGPGLDGCDSDLSC